MSDDIVSRSGAVVGQWDGKDVKDLQEELARIKREVPGDRVEPSGVPHQDQFPDDLKNFTAYILWGCDLNNVCLVGSGANRPPLHRQGGHACGIGLLSRCARTPRHT